MQQHVHFSSLGNAGRAWSPSLSAQSWNLSINRSCQSRRARSSAVANRSICGESATEPHPWRDFAQRNRRV